ncbi:HEAT repeat domain-containing protein [Candidatus Uabimicrobium sp. HlEnr_7]|uniref:HEAT repeat domain-containing protein n=1 Tax=Candidatus Uabimicrobium helgolandensis TaxID=3095367 RepID=UPI0035584CC2
MNFSQLQLHAHSLLEENYQHQEWLIRFTACEALAHIRDDRGIDTLIEGLQHASALIRERAVVAVTALQKPELYEFIEKYSASDNDASVCGYAIIAAAKLKPQQCFFQIQKGLSNKNDLVKQRAIESMHICSTQPAIKELKKIALGEYDNQLPYLLRLNAAYYLALEEKSGREALYTLLNSPDEWVQFITAKKLAMLNDSTAIPYLKNMITDGDWENKLSAIESLLLLEENVIEDSLFLKPTQAPDIFTKITAAIVLYKQFPDAAATTVKTSLESKEEELQLHVIHQITRSGHHPLLVHAKPILQSGRENVRAAITIAIEKSEDAELVVLLEPIIARSHWILRLQAAKTILKIAQLQCQKSK